MSMNVIAIVSSDSAKILEARQNVVIIYQGCEGMPQKKDDSVIINYTKKAIFELQNFIRIYNVEQPKKNFLVLYKSVKDNYTDFYTGKIKYEIGTTVECPDWDVNNSIECGGGLHLSPSIYFCKFFNKGKYLKCEVNIKDILVHPNPHYPYKIRCKKVKVLEEIKE